MKKLSINLLADTVLKNRKKHELTKAQLTELTGIDSSILSRIETFDYIPTTEQLQILAKHLDFDVNELFEEK